MNPNVSVIIPTYNRASLVSGAIESVLSQTYNDFEIIVIDDGSRDNTRDVVRAYGEKVRYFYQDNAGLAAARNHGIRQSGGRLIALLDDDDRWHRDKLSLQVKGAEGLPEPVFVCCNGLRGGVPISDISEPSGFITSPCEFRFPPSSWIMSRKVIEMTGGFDESYRKIGEDISFLMRAFSRGIKLYYMNNLLVFWNSTPGSLSDSAQVRLVCQERILNEFEDFMKKDRGYYFRYLYSLGKDALRLGDKGRARKYFQRAFFTMPWKIAPLRKYLQSVF